MTRLDRRSAFYVACIGIAVVVMLLIHCGGLLWLFWTRWVWLWN